MGGHSDFEFPRRAGPAGGIYVMAWSKKGDTRVEMGFDERYSRWLELDIAAMEIPTNQTI
jgi:hypothetical protein